ncbi:Gfo/Idh/MocA family protein [Aestuariirhabdus sp. LZHN29]|uniref:Gfo/Idh/MocA family protein n=1 Tax=Aestuariirhabdus sp. LZHN29 TaxID=3417462 RepID=UPI003CF26CB3
MSVGSVDKPLRVACIGAGYFSRFHYEAWSRMPDVEVVALCNRHPDAAQEIANEYGITQLFSELDTMLEAVKPDLVDIITPPITHADAIRSVARYGINAVCQKPFGQNLEQARELEKEIRNAGITVNIHENFRFMPWFRHIRAVVDDGVLGEILNARFALRPGDGQGADAYLARQPYFQTMERFLIHETAVHLVDTFRFLFGDPLSVYASLKRCNPVIAGEDAGTLLFEYANGLSAHFDGNRLLDHSADNHRRTMGECWIEGTQGTLRLDGSGRVWLRHFGTIEEIELNYDWHDQHFGGDCVYLLNRHVADHYLYGSILENRVHDYLGVLKIEDAIYRSHAEGRRIDLELDQ